ncbi:MAG: cupin domain-containing protein, partial [Halieaceae bacterium]|nr:cupin domain-containing protein [Halieaceae bacterium]
MYPSHQSKSLRYAAAMLAGALTLPTFAQDDVHPAELSRDDLSGSFLEGPDALVVLEDGSEVLDVTSLMSSDGRFASGMYRAGPSRSEINEPYGVDEFMYFLEGGVTLTSSDGTVTEIEAGEAVTIPKEWTGVWETDGYMKIWVIYS